LETVPAADKNDPRNSVMDPILATGFIGFHLARALVQQGRPMIGLENLNEYYDVNLKRARLGRLEAMPGFRFVRINLSDAEAIAELFDAHKYVTATNLAAQAGIRYSWVNPQAYVKNNV
jgi:UDP-glucuronate 4-epimerase